MWEVHFNSKERLQDICEYLVIFYPDYFPPNSKAKRQNSFREDFRVLYPSLISLENLIRQDLLIATQGLASNEVAIRELKKVYVDVINLSEYCLENVTRLIKNYFEMKPFCDNLIDCLHKKDFITMFITDLKDLNEQLGIEIDIKKEVNELKEVV